MFYRRKFTCAVFQQIFDRKICLKYVQNEIKSVQKLNVRNKTSEIKRPKIWASNVVIKKADKGTTMFIMNKNDKIHKGQVQRDDRQNYIPLEAPMVKRPLKRSKTLSKISIEMII